MRKHLVAQLELGLAAHLAVRLQLLQHRVVVGGVYDHGHVLPVLGGGAYHSGAAYVYVLYRFLKLYAGLGNGLTEGVEVYHDHVDGLYAQLLYLAHVLGVGAHGQQARMYRRVQRLYAPVQALREAGDVAHRGHGHAGRAQRLHRAARGQYLNAHIGQSARQFHYAGLVGNTYKSSLNHDILSSVLRIINPGKYHVSPLAKYPQRSNSLRAGISLSHTSARA